MAICTGGLLRLGDGGRRLEAAPVLGGRDTDRTHERATHRLGGAAPARGRDGVDRIGCLLEPAAGRLDPHPLDVARRGRADLDAEEAGEEARGTHPTPGAPPPT